MAIVIGEVRVCLKRPPIKSEIDLKKEDRLKVGRRIDRGRKGYYYRVFKLGPGGTNFEINEKYLDDPDYFEVEQPKAKEARPSCPPAPKPPAPSFPRREEWWDD